MLTTLSPGVGAPGLSTWQETANLAHRLTQFFSASYASLISCIPRGIAHRYSVLPVDLSLRLVRRNREGTIEERYYPDLPFGPGPGFGPNSRALRSSKLLLRLTTPFRFWLPHSGPPRKAASCLGSGGLSLGCRQAVCARRRISRSA